ncbi:winged helix-turn-helix transcriptional regulator [Kluyvera sichuanensis]
MNDTDELSDSKMPRQHNTQRTGCAVEITLGVIGGLWKPIILFHLLDGKQRFNQLCKLIDTATRRMITLQLRELEADGIVSRTVYAQVPPRVEYELTPLGASLKPVLLAMRDWGDNFQCERTQPK